tara:strand:- start:6191 stop:6463 length:273 start_codon:yes stop_codon:yes gene_type:complete
MKKFSQSINENVDKRTFEFAEENTKILDGGLDPEEVIESMYDDIEKIMDFIRGKRDMLKGDSDKFWTRCAYNSDAVLLDNFQIKYQNYVK